VLYKLSEKRENRITDYMHKASTYLVNLAVSMSANTIVIGINKEWKQDINIGKVNNQNFVYVPFNKFIKQIEYKCKLRGIIVIPTEESYTSKCSFIDGEEMCHHDEYLGNRIRRGMFKSAKGVLINADLNASYNILRKVVQDFVWIEGVHATHAKKVSF